MPDPVSALDTGELETAASDPFTDVLVGFAHELRAAGLTVGTGDLLDLYHAGRATLLNKHEDQPVYDRVFRAYFLGDDAPARERLMINPATAAQAEAALVMPGTEQGPEQD